jgi:hypothetical protein
MAQKNTTADKYESLSTPKDLLIGGNMLRIRLDITGFEEIVLIGSEISPL